MKIRTDILKLSKELHTWTGIISGIFLFICFVAGGLSVFQNQLTQWATPPAYHKKIDIDQYNALIHEVQKEVPVTHEQFQLNFSSNIPNQPPITWKVEDSNDSLIGFATIEDHQVSISKEPSNHLGHLIEILHETAGIPGIVSDEKVGVLFMGGISLLYFIAMLSGIILHLPTLIKDYFAIRKTKNQKRFWLDMHNVVGITNLPFHLVISVTVVVFAFHDLFYTGLSKITGQTLFEKPALNVSNIQKTDLDILEILAQVKKIAPEYRVDYMQFNQLNRPHQASVRIAIYSPNQMLRGANHNFLVMNPYTKIFVSTDVLNEKKSALDHFVQSMFSLHFGNFGGVWTRWIYLCLGVGGAFLFYSGNMLWIKSRSKKNKPHVIVLKKITLGTTLGSVLALSLSMACLKWGYAAGLPVKFFDTYFIYSYYLIFCLSILWVFIAEDSDQFTQYLLCIIALSLLSFSLTSIVAFILPNSGLWVSLGSLYVDLTAFVLGIIFFKLYKKRSG